jgi:hypothetical protein
MSHVSTEDITHIRILVLALGEAHHFNWWRSEFLSTTGISYFSRLYPRSKFSGAVQAVTRAALDLHDASIGVGSVYHLFRLPESLEYGVNNSISTQSNELEKIYLPILNDQHRLLEKLSKFVQKKERYKAGPIQLDEEMASHNIASAYAWAFQNSAQIFPYFLHK